MVPQLHPFFFSLKKRKKKVATKFSREVLARSIAWHAQQQTLPLRGEPSVVTTSEICC